jgi:hypothetical protein
VAQAYPNPDPALWGRFGALTPWHRLSLHLRNRRYRRRAASGEGIELDEAKPMAAPPGPRDPILLATVKDGMATLPSFLAHYRAQGLQHFAIVDDGSGDGSRAFLEAQPDVAVFTSNVGFRQAEGGLLWRDRLVERFGRGRWYVSIDSDEYLVFPGCETRPLSAFIADLERAGLKRALAPMLDLYPEGPIGALVPPADPAAPPTGTCPLFDGSHYSVGDEKFCTSIRGGPRNRLFGIGMRMTKFPLVFADEALAFAGGSHHGPLPITRNFAPPDAVLLHHKFAPGAVETFRTIAERGTHFNGSQFYKTILESGDFGPQTDFRYAGSVRFEGSEDLVRRGFMRDLRR